MKKKTYEVTCLMAHQDFVDAKLAEAQANGWEIAGDILIKNKDGDCNNHFFYIPMKRE